MGRKCTIAGCNSKTTGPQSPSQGVITYHSFPFESKVREKWIENCRLDPEKNITKSVLVCSRHFRSTDFKKTSASEDALMVKYWLKPGTVPTIFPWGKIKSSSNINSATQSTSASSSSSPVDTNETVKQTIAQIMAETAELNKAAGIDTTKEDTSADGQQYVSVIKRGSVDASSSNTEEPTYSVGAKVEAQDFSGIWHTAKVIEVDEKEVFIKYEKTKSSKSSTMSDEWIPMNSSRLRPKTSAQKPLFTYTVDEKVYAKWQARRFPAKVTKVLENDMYEVLFDDGYSKVVRASQMAKFKATSGPSTSTATEEPPSAPKKEEKKEWNLLSIKTLDLEAMNLPTIPDDGEWCCYWVNDQPIGEEGFLTVGDHKKPTVVVQDWRLPAGWIKHMYQRSNVLGKWDVILVSPQGKRFRSKADLKQFLSEHGQVYNPDIYDFSIHRRRSKDIGAYVFTDDYKRPPPPKPANSAYFMEMSANQSTSSSLATPNTSLIAEQLEATPLKESPPPVSAVPPAELMSASQKEDEVLNQSDDGYVYVGSLKVQLVDNLFKCPDEKCSKTFRKENHFSIHVKHYHPALVDKLGACPNMQELAYKRTFVTPQAVEQPKNQIPNQQFFAKLHMQEQQARQARKSHSNTPSTSANVTPMQSPSHVPAVSSILDESTPIASPLAVEIKPEQMDVDEPIVSEITAVSTPIDKKIGDRKSSRQRTTRKFFSTTSASSSSKVFDESFGVTDLEETRHSFNVTPDIQKSPIPAKKAKLHTPSNTCESTIDSTATIASSTQETPISIPVEETPKYIQENGELIKIVRMRQEEIINCVCTYGEEDGLMIQCELCLCWQHGTCHGIEKECQVPEKYICYICRNPSRGRESMKYIHDQEWLYDGRLPTAKYHAANPAAAERAEFLKKCHTVTGNLIELKRFLHSMQVKTNIIPNRDHPKLYLWSKDWESPTKDEKKIKDEKQEGGMQQMPQPEAAIDSTECQKILMKHLRNQKSLLQDKIDSLEQTVQELENADPLQIEDKGDFETCNETIRFISKDLETVQKLAHINHIAITASQQYQQPV